jgi:hypothetical protein
LGSQLHKAMSGGVLSVVFVEPLGISSLFQ